MGSVDTTVLCSYFNRAETVEISILSILSQTSDNYKVIVVDDGSTDNTFHILSKLSSPRLRIIRQNNKGFTKTISMLCDMVDTEFIAIHGAGDESLPTRIEKQRRMLRENPNLVAVGCGIENVDKNGSWEVNPSEEIKKGPIESGFGISHGELMMRTDAYRACGGYRGFFQVGQASDLFRRLSRIGDFGYVKEVLYRRYLYLDGVNYDLSKLAVRELLSSLSHSAHINCLESKASKDGIDMYGLTYPYFAASNRHLATALARSATYCWLNGDRAVARRLAKRSTFEKITKIGLITRIAILLGAGPFEPSFKRALVMLDRQKEEHSLKRYI